MLGHGHAAELREGRFEIVQLESIRPVVLVRGAEDFENFEDLIDLRIADEKWSTLYHLCKNATSGPQIDTKTVGFLTKEDLRASVPQRDNLMSVGLDGETKCARQSKISKLDLLAVGGDE